MIGPAPGAKVMVATKPVDFRKGADSLAALVAAEYERVLGPVGVHAPHEEKHDHHHGCTHDEGYPEASFTPEDMVDIIGINVHQAEHDDCAGADHGHEAPIRVAFCVSVVFLRPSQS